MVQALGEMTAVLLFHLIRVRQNPCRLAPNPSSKVMRKRPTDGAAHRLALNTRDQAVGFRASAPSL